MKKSKFKKKTLVFYLILAALLIMSQPMKAQNGKSDGFFTNYDGGYENRDEGSLDVTGNISNDSFGAPLGSGLLIMVAAGLCYALKIKTYEKN